ncbi:inovirus-type Gp2 protein [Cognaticolwellia mytili]|uniref:inovirus-type Gp2 protein n=1 Tax=Cognaticolwellia mytili TaxID=1888913 RepID=UPI001301E786|nr:inovirus-type Gp2 protein [Cognaticolwellia mytili]
MQTQLTNRNYTLPQQRVTSLANTLNHALSAFNIVAAVRLDFAYSGRTVLDHPSISIFNAFDTFMNRLRRMKVKGEIINFFVSWKKEFSQAKGEHIHTVFYFNHSRFSSFDATSHIFKKMNTLWQTCSMNLPLGQKAYINIIPAYYCENDDVFRAKPSNKVNGHQYKIKNYFTILTKDKMAREQLPEYHKQKHLFHKACGFFHWISYLAKTEQQAAVRKSLGSVRNG